ncbi:MAG: STAS domain-containing protein [Acidimicrobiia bacterium]
MTPLATLDTTRLSGWLVVVINGEIDLSNAANIGARLEDATKSEMAVAIDLSPIRYIDSQGVRLLYQLSQRFAAKGVELAFVAPADSIAGQVLKLSHLSDLVPILESLD